MKSHEIFRQMSSQTAVELLTYLQNEHKPIYNAAVQGLANQRNLRAVFVQRKPPDERYSWLKAALGRGISETIAGHVLQAWLLGENKAMLCDFLDAMEIKHSEDGTIDELPPEPPKEKIANAVAQLLAKYPAERVAIYLHAFRDMDGSVQWSALDQILAQEPRLLFGGSVVAP
jgi:hypothetical protein